MNDMIADASQTSAVTETTESANLLDTLPLWVPISILLLSLTLFTFLVVGFIAVEGEETIGWPGAVMGFATVTPTLDPAVPRLGEEYLNLPATSATPVPSYPYYAEANEMGKVLVLMYHRIAYPETRYQRTPENMQADLERLYQSGYYPVNFIDLIRGLPDVPPAKKPIVITFDDSDITQFRVLADNTIDASSALGIMLNFHKQHGQEWPLRATFFVLADDRNDYHSLFGQPKFAKAKLKLLAKLGLEVGSHTVTHADLSVATAERIYWELAVSQHIIEEMIPNYEVQSLSVPFGGFPFTLEFLKAGRWGNYRYTYTGNAAAWGGPSPSPHNETTFQIYKIPRMEVTEDSLNYWLDYFELNPEEYYVSDGDPNRLTYPEAEPALTKVQE